MQWVAVKGYEEQYEVSDAGVVRNARTGRVLTPMWCGSHGKKYATVALCGGGAQRKRRVHHLVLEAFAGPRPAGHIACHRDDDKRNNRADNLYWGNWHTNARDRVANNHHAGQKLTTQQVVEIRRRRDAGERGVDLAKEFGVSQQVVWSVYKRRTGGWIE